MQICPSTGFIRVFYQYVYKYLFALYLSSSGGIHVDWLFTNEEQTKLVCDLFDTFITPSGLVYDVTDRDC